MKNFFYILLFLNSFLNAQTIVKDSTTMTAGYANQIWYSMAKGTVGTAPKNNWDIAFEMTKFSAGIALNHAIGLTLQVYPVGNANNWSDKIDTSNFKAAPLLYNTDTSWSYGAFNQNRKNGFDYGWGTYNQVTHNLVGDSIFIIKFANGTYKKLIIESLVGDKTYNVKYADIDGMNETVFSVDKDSYKDKNYVYYSFATKQIIDREPKKIDWDITFTQYNTLTQNLNYTVMGVLVNNNVQAIKALADSSNYGYLNKTFNNNMSEIGFEWKNFDLATNKWTIYNANSYFVKNGTKIWKINFTGFGGSGTGKSFFNKSLVAQSTATNSTQAFDKLNVYPNPNNGNIISLDFSTTIAIKDLNVKIIDLTGRLHLSNQYIINANQSTIQLENLNLNAGIYFLQLSGDDYNDTIKVIIE
jgi:Secretion system C-terminal sorting domain